MSAQKTKAAGHLAAIFTMLIWGTTFISTKVLLEDLSPLEILVLRFVAGYIFLWIIRPVPLKAGSLKQEGIMIVAGITGIGIYYLMENIALTLTQASNISVIVSIAYFYRYSGPLFPGRGENEEEYRSGICVCNGRHLSDHIPERGDSRVKSTGRFPWCGSGSHLGSIFHLFQKNSRFWI